MYTNFWLRRARSLRAGIFIKRTLVENFDKIHKGIREDSQIFTLKLCDLVY